MIRKFSLYLLALFVLITCFCGHSDNYAVVNFARVPVYSAPLPDSSSIAELNYLFKIWSYGEVSGLYTKVGFADPYTGAIYSGWMESRYVTSMENIEKMHLNMKKTRKEAIAECKRRFNDSCSDGCTSGSCESDALLLLELGWTPSVLEWTEYDELQLLIFDGRGPEY